jgi:hypothetical protein
MERGRRSLQRDLFASAMPTAGLPPEVRRRVLPLLAALLREVTTDETPAPEGSDEQDHA